MVARRLDRKGHSPQSSHRASSGTRNASTSSTWGFTWKPSSPVTPFGEQRTPSSSSNLEAQTASSNQPNHCLTPSPTPSLFNQGRVPSPSLAFGQSQAASEQVRTFSFPNIAGTPCFTSSPTPSRFGQERVSTPSVLSSDKFDPDRPLMSVERDVSTSSRQSTPNRLFFTPPTSTYAESTRQAVGQDSVLHSIDGFRDLRLSSPQTSGIFSPKRDASTPSINVIPSAAPIESNKTQAARTDSLVNGVEGLHIGSVQADSPDALRLREGRSISPSNRRRSGPRINEEPHQVESEAPPHASFHLPEVQEALFVAKTMVSEMLDVLSSSHLHEEKGTSIEGLHRQASKLNNFQLPSSRVVGLVGDSSVGKSSLINSLLDKIDLARSSGKGAACTCAATEYLFHDRDDYVVHIDYFPLDQLKKQFKELLRAYRDYQLLLQISSTRDADNADDKERERLKGQADFAETTMRASFGARLDSVPTILSSMPFEYAVGVLYDWIAELLPLQNSPESFSTAEACSSRLMNLTSVSDESSSNKGPQTCWPFIQKVRVYLKAHILKGGLTLVDLPGLRDRNSARRAITERYVRDCHHIFIVAEIDPVITNESIKEIFELASRVNLSRIDIVCTKSEGIEADEAKKDWPTEKATIEEMQTKIEEANKEVAEIKDEMDEYYQGIQGLTREEGNKFFALQREKRKAEEREINHKFQLKRHIVNLRNERVSTGLRQVYQKNPLATGLRIFCVSNRLYKEHRKEPAAAAKPHLELSGILELRNYCIEIVAQSRLRATREFIQDELPAFLGSVELWVEAGSGSASAKKKQQVLDSVSMIQQDLNNLKLPTSRISAISRDMDTDFNNQICLPMKRMGREWARESRQASMDWQTWHPSSYKAFCSNFGEWRTDRVGWRCWNQEALKGMNDDMSYVWESLLLDLKAQFERVNSIVVDNFDSAVKTALATGEDESDAAERIFATQTLAMILQHRKDLTLCGFENANESFDRALSSLHSDIFSSIRTAFIGKLMEDTYHAAIMEYGDGSDRRRKDLITRRFSSSSLFNDHRRDSKKKFRHIVRGLQDALNTVLTQQIGAVEADLQMLRNENVVLESERNPEFRKRVKAEVEKAKCDATRIGRVVGDVC